MGAVREAESGASARTSYGWYHGSGLGLQLTTGNKRRYRRAAREMAVRKVGNPRIADPAAGAARLLSTTLAAAAFAAVLHAVPSSAEVQPSSLEFGDVPFGGASAARTVQIFAPYPAVFKSIFGYDRVQVSQSTCAPFQSAQCPASIVATNSRTTGPFGPQTGKMSVQYTYGDNATDYITVSANFLPPPPPKTWL